MSMSHVACRLSVSDIISSFSCVVIVMVILIVTVVVIVTVTDIVSVIVFMAESVILLSSHMCSCSVLQFIL